MPQMDLYNLEAKVVGSVDLADAVFNIEPNNQAIYDAVLLQQASMRQGTHKTKTRTEVSGGGKKPFPNGKTWTQSNITSGIIQKFLPRIQGIQLAIRREE